MITRAVARHLAATILGLSYDPTAPGGNVFVQWSPASPDLIVSVMGTGGLPQLTLDPDDSPTFQTIVRGSEADPDEAYRIARAIYDQLNGLDNVLLAAGTDDEVWLIGCTAQQSEPIPMGLDANNRPEWSQNYQAATHAPTTHRPQ